MPLPTSISAASIVAPCDLWIVNAHAKISGICETPIPGILSLTQTCFVITFVKPLLNFTIGAFVISQKSVIIPWLPLHNISDPSVPLILIIHITWAPNLKCNVLSQTILFDM